MKENEIYKIIGKNIKKYRQLNNINNKKLTQQELAKLIGVSTSLIGSMESNKSNQGISIYNLYKISIILKTPINKFFK